ncbi:cell cycle checkpoint control protein RAD9A isoform X2 [Rhinatrema bivittatum]|uniref:cell cycle checkpoint control protein RAD9A isoform X2 n=1 Tax=Rhinatrema bivittatum TaxID=194408 RepID=UPI00112D6D01|nr:cell cycle checkpoint control protein RAD9A isoform X2 [Rhinatrema bivittatum]
MSQRPLVLGRCFRGRRRGLAEGGMKCLVTGGNVKVLGKAIHSLFRIGDEVYFEPLEDGSILNIFRSLPSLEKTVEKCRISLNPKASRLVIQLLCKYGVVKTHNLSFQECESLQAVFNKDVCPNLLRAPARLLVDAVVHFPVALSEVTLAPSCGGRVIFRNYMEDETDPNKMMLTEMALNEDEFLHFQVRKESEITFCLKEFRGLLNFAESSSLPVSIHFDVAGRPVVFSLEDPVLEVHFVLATLSEPEVGGSQSLPGGSLSQDANRLSPSETAADDFMNDDIDSYMIAMETTTGEEAMANGCRPPLSPTFPLKGSGRAAGRPTGRRKDLSMLLSNGPGSEGEEEEAGEVPGTPPNKKFRSLFFGSVLAHMDAPHHTGLKEEVLAEASDVEEDS